MTTYRVQITDPATGRDERLPTEYNGPAGKITAEFAPADASGPYEDWFDRGPVRVIVAGTYPEDLDEVTIHKFTDDPAMLLVWSASFTPTTPTAVVQGAITAAVKDES